MLALQRCSQQCGVQLPSPVLHSELHALELQLHILQIGHLAYMLEARFNWDLVVLSYFFLSWFISKFPRERKGGNKWLLLSRGNGD